MLYYLKGKIMFDKLIYESLHVIMKYAGMLNAWAWRKHVKIIRDKQQEDNEEYLKERELNYDHS